MGGASARRWAAPALAALALVLAAPGPAAAAECEGDSCQVPPAAPEDPTPGTAMVEGPPNPPARFPSHGHKRKHPHKKHHGNRRHKGKRRGHR